MRKVVIIFFILCSSYISITLLKKIEKKGCFRLSQNLKVLPLEEKNKIKFIAVGDVGTGSVYQASVASAIKDVCRLKPCDFLLFLGDNFYEKGVESVYDIQFQTKYEKFYKDIKVPVYPVLGNHDVKGDYLSQVFYSLRSLSWSFPNTYYAIKSKFINLYGLNSNCNVLQWQQLNDLSENSNQNNWTFVFAHHPIFSSGFHGDTDAVSRSLFSFYGKDIDFYLNGHDHHLEHLSLSNIKTEFIVSGAGGKKYNGNKKSDSSATSQFYYPDYGFVYFEVSQEKVLVEFYDAYGKIIYDFEKTKSPGST